MPNLSARCCVGAGSALQRCGGFNMNAKGDSHDAGQREWLETNRHSSFALGCVDRRLRRKYHALLTLREPGRGDPWNVIADARETLHLGDHAIMLADPLARASEEAELLEFQHAPHVLHTYRAFDITVERRVRLASQHDQVEVRYRFRGITKPVRFSIEPLLRGRPLHELTFENAVLNGALVRDNGGFVMEPYPGMPRICMTLLGADATLHVRGSWHRRVNYEWEAARGYDHVEDVFSPGSFDVELQRDGEITFVVGRKRTHAPEHDDHDTAPANFAAALGRASRQFVMKSSGGHSFVIAGYPWFGPWGRDTLIALPGLHLALNDLELTSAMLRDMLKARVNGLIPNIPAISGFPANTASVDATLLFVRAVQWLAAHEGPDCVASFMPEVCSLLDALAEARDPRMRLDDGIGVWTEPGAYAMTWMDAMVDGVPVTPRHGYAVDIDALAYNAAHFALDWAKAHHGVAARALSARLKDAEARFQARFWDDRRGYLADTHNGQFADGSLRPNQLWALGLPYSPLTSAQRSSSLEHVTRALLVPAGLRTLAPGHHGYQGRYAGSQAERDRAYHQGTVWPWLLGIYADAVIATRGREALEEAVGPCLSFMAQHVASEGCIGQINEVFDGDAPHHPAGAPAQAWSVTEVYRVWRLLHSAAKTS